MESLAPVVWIQCTLAVTAAAPVGWFALMVDGRSPPAGHEAELLVPYWSPRRRHWCASDGPCYCWRRPGSSERLVDCSAANLTDDEVERRRGGLERVVELDLSGNALRRAPVLSCDSLRSLNLAGNRIARVAGNLIGPNLQALYLDHNLIESVERQFLRAVLDSTSIRAITLHGNPLRCGCDATSLDLLRRTAARYPSLSNVSCAGGGEATIDDAASRDELCPPRDHNDDGLARALVALAMLAWGVALYLLYVCAVAPFADRSCCCGARRRRRRGSLERLMSRDQIDGFDVRGRMPRRCDMCARHQY